MSLTASLNIARSALAAVSAETAVISRNIAGAGEEGYARRGVNLEAVESAGVRVLSTARSADTVAFKRLLSSSADAAGNQALAAGLDRLHETIGDAEDGRSPAALIAGLESALQIYADTPGDPVLAANAVESARLLSGVLNEASAATQEVRRQADRDMAASVDNINDLLARLEVVNSAITRSDASYSNYNDNLDARDTILKQLSLEVGIRVVTREDNDVVVFADNGLTLFETQARSVAFQPTELFTPATAGNAVFIDGVAVTGASATMPLSGGRLEGLARLRDDAAVTYQSQLDEVARGLIEAFAETDQSVPATQPDVTGLFTYAGGPALPAGATVSTGLAALISVNPLVDPAAGGDSSLLRDGGINGATYIYNTSGASGFAGRLQGLISSLSQSRAFDPAAQAAGSASVGGFAASSVSWLEGQRTDVHAESSYRETLRLRTAEALSHRTGVNIDEEMTILLELERSFEASARLISAVDQMFAALLAASR